MDVVPDEQLVASVAEGDREALAELYRRHAVWIGGRLSAMTSSRELAEEALQDTFLAVWRKPGAFRAEGPVAAWLWGIARRRLVSLIRRSPGSTPIVEPQWEEGPEEVVLAEDEVARIRTAVIKLPRDQREAIEAVVFRGESVAATAQAMGVAEGTVKSRLHRARVHIKEELQR